ncbi:sugar ABC transporter ATP-binding protein [Virgibacillus natechei]
MDSTENILELHEIEKAFYGKKVLHRVNLQLRKGEVQALVGENGAGKSTLIKVIAGIYKQDHGKVIFNQEVMEINKPQDAINSGISTIHQEFNLVPYLDAASNIFLNREKHNFLGRINKNAMYEETKEIFNRIGSNINPNTPISKLGVAEKQMVEIAKALSFNAKVIIMDEPTAVLSGNEVSKLFKVISSLKKQGVSIIYISHHLEELFEIVDRVTVLRDGNLIDTLHISEVNKQILTKKMIGRDLDKQFPDRESEIGEDILTVTDLQREGVLEEINFSLRKGEILGIAGLVGAGRTELVRAIAGIDQYDSGKLNFDGVEVDFKSPYLAIKSGVCLIPEERKSQGLVLDLSVEKNITLPNMKDLSHFGHVLKKESHSTSEKYINELRVVPESPSRLVKFLSGGNQQKVVIGKWLFKKYKVVIFDEPTRGVDVGAKAEIYKIINNIVSKGTGVIMVSSDLPEILGMSDRILVMKEGKIAKELINQNLDEEEVLKYAF